jgi:hypothetical protein
MYRLFSRLSTNAVLFAFGLTTVAVTPIAISIPASAQENTQTQTGSSTTPKIDLSQLQQPQSFNKQNTENEGKIEVDIEDEDVEVDIRPRLNYIGVGGNIGLGGDSAIGEGSFTVFSKVGLTRNLSTRPAVAIDEDPTILLPLTYDFASQTVDPIEGGPVDSLTISPYIGAGLGIEASDDADVGALITGGLDLPLSSEFMLNAAANVLFLDDTDVGLMLGVGYRF